MAYFTANRMARMAVSSYRRAKRDQARRVRESAAQYKAQQKRELIEDAREAVADYDEYITRLKGVHLDPVQRMDWERISKAEEPPSPEADRAQEIVAQKVLDQFRPGLLDKVFGRTESKRKRLQEGVAKAKQSDTAAHVKAMSEFNEEFDEWRKMSDLSVRVLQCEPAAYKEAVEFLKPFEDLTEFGSEVSMSMTSSLATVEFKAKEASVVPDYVLSQTSTGKLSKKAMSKGRFNEIYQDYVCSCVLRLANETFSVLPVQTVVVNVLGDQVNQATGHLEERPILSVLVKPETLAKLNIASLDPSDSMRNFIHNMKFSKMNGFSVVQRIELAP